MSRCPVCHAPVYGFRDNDGWWTGILAAWCDYRRELPHPGIEMVVTGDTVESQVVTLKVVA
jgi:hypothetical protein